MRETKRDAGAEYLLRSIDPKPWQTLNDIYQYFLIDVDSGDCSTISRVVAATMSAQLYVHRAIMNLEQDALPPNDPMHVALRMPADAVSEWDWRRNYRVWQANRKVFLWPENYLDPDLRDDKTPLFTADSAACSPSSRTRSCAPASSGSLNGSCAPMRNWAAMEGSSCRSTSGRWRRGWG